MGKHVLEFEKPVFELEAQIQKLRDLAIEQGVDLNHEITQLEATLANTERAVYESLSPWQRIRIARHPDRLYTSDYIKGMTRNFVELHGDRAFADDKAIIGGLAIFEGMPVMILGHQKGRDVKENIMRNFGSAHPEGYRKAMRLMHLAEKFGRPIIILVDTPGAYPGIGAEERGQAHLIAHNLREMSVLRVPIVVTVIGEGGSGGALGIGIADRVNVLQYAYYSVISPEGCAAILWKDPARASTAADVLKITAGDLLKLGVVDAMVEEPLGGVHRNPPQMIDLLRTHLKRDLDELTQLPVETLVEKRYDKFRKMGQFIEESQKKVENPAEAGEQASEQVTA
ncbi:MAG: acetyl-CoA carboxylase carboxyltransferase subunit alpha [Candidatus Omnitrophica bacterium]|nr:acetyl-CoA carboxylase carboxyltransferase subunit alpha [Candidatus Omnitrophota bacterium]